MIVISDTSVITHLMQLDLVHLLKDLYQKVIIPNTVKLELERIELQKKILQKNEWIETKTLQNKDLYSSLLNMLDPGESEAIALAVELKPDFLLIDERKGRKIALEFGIQITGILGVLVDAKDIGLIEELKPILDQLIFKNGFRVSQKLFDRVLEMAGEK